MDKIGQDEYDQDNQQKTDEDQDDNMLLSTEETSQIENCENVDLGDPFEEYDGVATKFNYGDHSIHQQCIKKKDVDGSKPDEKLLLKLQEEKKTELIE